MLFEQDCTDGFLALAEPDLDPVPKGSNTVDLEGRSTLEKKFFSVFPLCMKPQISNPRNIFL